LERNQYRFCHPRDLFLKIPVQKGISLHLALHLSYPNPCINRQINQLRKVVKGLLATSVRKSRFNVVETAFSLTWSLCSLLSWSLCSLLSWSLCSLLSWSLCSLLSWSLRSGVLFGSLRSGVLFGSLCSLCLSGSLRR
jgi:hypothetical protein